VNPLKAKILELIREQGPIPVAEYMRIALSDPEHGYYMRRDPFGVTGDFVTAPEVSQMFGETFGLFFVQAWEDRGRPARFHLVELGPGRGTLMADMLRAGKIRPAFLSGAQVTLIETSPHLREMQKTVLAGADVRWADSIDGLEPAPLFLIANEFFDALPARQYVKSKAGWQERTIAAKDDSLMYALSQDCEPEDFAPPHLRDADEGAILERSADSVAVIRTIADRIAGCGGVALIVDYGHAKTQFGDTFQAVKQHAYADPLAEPGEADLTFHVDFEALARGAQERGAHVSGPVTQGAFLEALGIGLRAERLKCAGAEGIDAALERLVAPAQMGTLFKVMAISDGRSALPGFAC
jgi:SAM-dependent MidA family methyltransferase